MAGVSISSPSQPILHLSRSTTSRNISPATATCSTSRGLLIGNDSNADALSDFVTITPEPGEIFVSLAVDRDGSGADYASATIATLQDYSTLTLAMLEADGLILD